MDVLLNQVLFTSDDSLQNETDSQLGRVTLERLLLRSRKPGLKGEGRLKRIKITCEIWNAYG